MGKSAEEKRIEERMLVRKAKGNIKRYIEKLEAAQKTYIEQAKTAKLQGVQSQYKLARSGLAMALRQKTVAEQLLLNLELNEQVKDASENTKNFVTGMNSLGREIAQVNGKIDVNRTRKRMRAAMTSSAQVQDRLGEFMGETEMLFGDMGSDAGMDNELDAMINREVMMDERNTVGGVDEEIDRLLKTVK